MTKLKEGGHTFVGRCMSCKKNAKLQDIDVLKLCHDCEEKFYDELFKKVQEEEFGKDIVNNERLKKRDD